MRQLLVAFLLLVCAPAFAAPESIEGFSFGTSADEVVQRIGEPSDIDGPVFRKDIKAWVWSWEYRRYGALFEVEAETQEGRKMVRSLTIVAPCPWKLGSGLGIGSTSDQIMQWYPNVNKVQDTLWFIQDTEKRNVTGFELAGTRVKSIFIGSKTQ